MNPTSQEFMTCRRGVILLVLFKNCVDSEGFENFEFVLLFQFYELYSYEGEGGVVFLCTQFLSSPFIKPRFVTIQQRSDRIFATSFTLFASLQLVSKRLIHILSECLHKLFLLKPISSSSLSRSLFLNPFSLTFYSFLVG